MNGLALLPSLNGLVAGVDVLLREGEAADTGGQTRVVRDRIIELLHEMVHDCWWAESFLAEQDFCEDRVSSASEDWEVDDVHVLERGAQRTSAELGALFGKPVQRLG
jgi:hypothetical protein